MSQVGHTSLGRERFFVFADVSPITLVVNLVPLLVSLPSRFTHQSTPLPLNSLRSYPSMATDAAGDPRCPYRWLLVASDTRALYRQYNRMQGVDTKEPAHVNIDEWLDPNSLRYKKTFADAIFHYSARASKEDRFEVCVATPEMQSAAWEYGNESQIILDGTFGISRIHLLLRPIRKPTYCCRLQYCYSAAVTGVLEGCSGNSKRQRFRCSCGNHGHRSQRAQCISARLPQDLPTHLSVPPVHIHLKSRMRRLETALVESLDFDEAHRLIQAELDARITYRVIGQLLRCGKAGPTLGVV